MEYEITQIISYLVTADTPAEALDIWNSHPKTALVDLKDDNIELIDERVELNG